MPLALLLAAAAVMEVDPGLPTHTVYRPADLAAATRTGPLPIVGWANGGCRNEGNRFRPFLEEIAARGYLVVAIGPIAGPDVEKPAPPKVRVAPPKQSGDPDAPPPKTRWQQLGDAIDWAVAENGRVGSPWQGRLDPQKIAVMGQSCGGLQALKYSASDPRVKTSVIWNSGVLPGSGGLPGAETVKADLDTLHAPIAYISGDAGDVAFPNADDDFARITKVPVVRAWKAGVGHSGTYREPAGGAFAPVAIGWLDWQLKGSAAGKAMFLPAGGCALCRTPGWTVKSKGF
ncbi:MAG: hypothetical protein PGN09_13100 [Sphingomonas fennica]